MPTKKSSNDTSPVFNVPAVAQQVGVTRQTIYNWIDAGIIQYSQRIGESKDGAPLFTPRDLEQVKRVATERDEKRHSLRLDRK